MIISGGITACLSSENGPVISITEDQSYAYVNVAFLLGKFICFRLCLWRAGQFLRLTDTN